MSWRLVLLMKCPEFLEVLGFDELVDAVVGLGAQERRSTIEHDEQHHSCCEHVGSESSIGALLHFWRFISLCADAGSELVVPVVSSRVARQAEVGHLEGELSIEEDVLGLEVAVRNVYAHEVGNGR